MSFYNWFNNRENGLSFQGDQDFLLRHSYRTLAPFHHFHDETSELGAIFNLEFSPEGNVLVGACEKKAICLFDAVTTKEITRVPNAHTDYVNCIKFLDNRIFASCSDDTTVALWDLRNLSTKVRSLHGHSNWVKNIEYSRKNNLNLLVTSGFDGSIFTWDINSATEQGLIYQKVFHTSGLMRCRITPDGEKLIICTTGGYIMIIHNLDLTTLHKDLCGFRPGVYRLMQMGNQFIPQAAKFHHVFSKSQKKNRVELVTDFPADNDAEVILALEIHPHGHSFLSRNISHDELSEWSCIHDLNEEPDDITEKPRRKRKLSLDSDEDSTEESESTNNQDAVVFTINRRMADRPNLNRTWGLQPPLPPPPPVATTSSSSSSRNNNTGSSSTTTTTSAPAANRQSRVLITHRQENFVPDIWAAEVTVQERAIRQNRTRGSNSTGYNYVYAISSGVLPAAVSSTRSTGTMTGGGGTTTTANSQTSTTRRHSSSSSSAASVSSTLSNRRQQGSPEPNFTADSNSSSSSSLSDSPPHFPGSRIRVRSFKQNLNRSARQIFQNPKKLLYYIQESNSGKGFIKEPCFSRDGRIVCSPYDKGVRLLGFNKSCSEFPRQLNQSGRRENPKELVEIQNISAHSEIVFSTKFSPRETLLVTGCRSGKVVWYYPKL